MSLQGSTLGDAESVGDGSELILCQAEKNRATIQVLRWKNGAYPGFHSRAGVAKLVPCSSHQQEQLTSGVALSFSYILLQQSLLPSSLHSIAITAFPFLCLLYLCAPLCVPLGKLTEIKSSLFLPPASASATQIKRQTCCEIESVPQVAARSHKGTVPISSIPAASH